MESVKANPEATLRKLAAICTEDLPAPAMVTDKVIYRLVVGALGIVAVAAIMGAIYLSATVPDRTFTNIPDVITALGAAAIGALAGLLAPSPGSNK